VPDLLLWLDFETTGLDPDVDTVLECAWCFTTSELSMVTPLRSRYTNLLPDSATKYLLPFQGRPVDWSNLTPVVSEMHTASGLRDNWMNANTGHVAVLRHPAELHRLIADDFEDAAIQVGAKPDECRIVLCGRGVSHFDNRVLAKHRVMCFDRIDDVDAPISVAYFQHDVSVAARVLGIQTPVLQHGLDGQPFEVVACQAGVIDDVCTRLLKDALGPGEFNLAALVAHRAADDVVEALVTARLLRAEHTPWPHA
jgi:hypothetical protein